MYTHKHDGFCAAYSDFKLENMEQYYHGLPQSSTGATEWKDAGLASFTPAITNKVHQNEDFCFKVSNFDLCCLMYVFVFTSFIKNNSFKKLVSHVKL